MDARSSARARVCNEYGDVLEAMSSAVQASNEQIQSLQEYVRALESENTQLRDEVSQLRAVLKHSPPRQKPSQVEQSASSGLLDPQLSGLVTACAVKDGEDSDEFASSLRVASAHRQPGDWVPPRFESIVATAHAQLSVPLRRSPTTPLAIQEPFRDFDNAPALSLSCLESKPLQCGSERVTPASGLSRQGEAQSHWPSQTDSARRRHAPFTEKRRASLRKASYRPVRMQLVETCASQESSADDHDNETVETASPPPASELVRRLVAQMRQRAVQVDKLYYSMDRFRTDSASFGEFSEGLQMCGIQFGLEEQAELFAEIDTEQRHRISWHQLRDRVEPLLDYLRERALARRAEKSDGFSTNQQFSPSYSQQTISSAQKASPQKFYQSPRRKLLQDSVRSTSTDFPKSANGRAFNDAIQNVGGDNLGSISV